ncbi:FecR family protein [Flavobacterium sp. AG291]|uniref:FecR family protein n=1 Tax=Flavobacterium sp. AG291 TaxID=2184000 RepID=UPI000E0A442C|nr:FecR domain-containing protein [Flavobacterium sp. AG291]RDI12105.1 FecR family protein [Flavobacterium sp. AG291]
MNNENMLAKWLNNELDEKELKAFMATPEYATYNKIKEYSAQLTIPEADMDTLYSRIEANKNRPVKVRTMSPWISRIAAMLILALGVTYFVYTNKTTTAFAENGQRTEFLLPDNSSVTLNSGSEADYKAWNWKNNRKLHLDGEAYFKVAKGQTFDVITTMGKVTVVGTQFNVKARDNRFDVTCFEGKVRVSSNGNTILLTPGMSVAFDNGKQLDMPSDEDTQPGWLTYEVNYQHEELGRIIEEMKRQYRVDIELSDKQISTIKHSGKIPMNNIGDALEIIETAHHLKSHKAGNKIILSVE